MNEVIPITGGWSVLENLQEIFLEFFEIMAMIYIMTSLICLLDFLLFMLATMTWLSIIITMQ